MTIRNGAALRLIKWLRFKSPNDEEFKDESGAKNQDKYIKELHHQILNLFQVNAKKDEISFEST